MLRIMTRRGFDEVFVDDNSPSMMTVKIGNISFYDGMWEFEHVRVMGPHMSASTRDDLIEWIFKRFNLD